MSAIIRRATDRDLPAILGLLTDDALGASRDDATLPLDPRYIAAFAAICADPRQIFAVMEENGHIIGCLQITLIPGLSRRGMWRGLIESVRIASARRGQGCGRRMFEWAIDACRAQGCGMVQLTTDKSRPDALRFYRSLGFVNSHEGMKRPL